MPDKLIFYYFPDYLSLMCHQMNIMYFAFFLFPIHWMKEIRTIRWMFLISVASLRSFYGYFEISRKETEFLDEMRRIWITNISHLNVLLLRSLPNVRSLVWVNNRNAGAAADDDDDDALLMLMVMISLLIIDHLGYYARITLTTSATFLNLLQMM